MAQTNEKQKDLTRSEMLIAIAYMLECCDSPENLTFGDELCEYSEKHFGVIIDRRRTTAIFEYLNAISKKYSKILPFRVKEGKIKEKVRYYIEKNILSESDISKIICAIKNDNRTTQKECDKLINNVLKALTTKVKEESIIKKADEWATHINHISDSNAETFKYLKEFKESGKRIFFKLKNPEKAHWSLNGIYNKEGLTRILDSNNSSGYVFDTYYMGKSQETSAVIYLNRGTGTRCCFTTTLDNLKLLKVDDLDIFRAREWIIDSPEKTVSNWMDSHYNGLDKNPVMIIFEINANDDENVKNMKKYLGDFYSKNKYSLDIVERTSTKFDNSGNQKEIINKIASFTIKSNFGSFEKFLVTYSLLEDVTIVSPANLNNLIYGKLIRKYIDKVNNHGDIYTYSLNKVYKENVENK